MEIIRNVSEEDAFLAVSNPSVVVECGQLDCDEGRTQCYCLISDG